MELRPVFSSEQPGSNMNGSGFAECDLFELRMRRVEEVIGFASDDAWQCQYGGPRRFYPVIANGFRGGRRRFSPPVGRPLVGWEDFNQRVFKF